jgi:hypothetical protein
MMTGMNCMPISRLERLVTFTEDYESCCEVSPMSPAVEFELSRLSIKRVADQYGKNFDFFKQHATSHIARDIWAKGTTNHGSTRPGEGFQQEAAEAYNQTNFKNVAAQVSFSWRHQ